MFVCLFVGWLVGLFVCLFVCLLVCLFVCLFACLLVCLFVCLFVCVFVFKLFTFIAKLFQINLLSYCIEILYPPQAQPTWLQIEFPNTHPYPTRMDDNEVMILGRRSAWITPLLWQWPEQNLVKSHGNRVISNCSSRASSIPPQSIHVFNALGFEQCEFFAFLNGHCPHSPTKNQLPELLGLEAQFEIVEGCSVSAISQHYPQKKMTRNPRMY